MMAQKTKLKNLKSMNVGIKNDAMVKVMFTTPTEEYFYATFKDVKIKRVNITRIDAKIRKADSVCIELTVLVDNPKQTKKLFKQAKKEFGMPQSKVFKSPTAYDWVWNEKKYTRYIESKSFHYLDANKAEFKIILITQ
jgi:hypothetical protein